LACRASLENWSVRKGSAGSFPVISAMDCKDKNIFGDIQRQQIRYWRWQRKENNIKIGWCCSSFDLLHAGHALMLRDCRKQCDVLLVGLQTDPTIDRPEKNKPIQSFEERKIVLADNRCVEDVIEYQTECDLAQILGLLLPDVRILGSDWKGKEFTGIDLPIQIYWHERNHNWSTSELRKRIYLAEKMNEN